MLDSGFIIKKNSLGLVICLWQGLNPLGLDSLRIHSFLDTERMVGFYTCDSVEHITALTVNTQQHREDASTQDSSDAFKAYRNRCLPLV